MPNSSDADKLSGLFIARRRRRSSADLLVKGHPNDAGPLVFGDWLFDEAVIGGGVDATLAVTDASDSLTSVGSSSATAVGVGNDAADTLAGQGQSALNAAFSATDADDSLTGVASVGAAGVDAALSVTDEADSSTAAAQAAATAAAGLSDAADTLNAVADVVGAGVNAELASTDEDDAADGTASVIDATPVSLGGRSKHWLFDIPSWVADVDAAMRDDDDHLFAVAMVADVVAKAIVALEIAPVEDSQAAPIVLKRTARQLRRTEQTPTLRRSSGTRMLLRHAKTLERQE